MVKESIQITESAVKLAGLGAKNLAALLIAVLNDEKKLQGKTNLKQLLKADKPLCILQIKTADLTKFNTEAKKYGVLFTAVADKTNNTGLCDIIARQEDVTKLNYLMEKLGYAAPVRGTDAPEREQGGDIGKNSPPRAEKKRENQQRSASTQRGDTAPRESVRAKIADIKAKQAAERKNRPKRRQKEKSI